MTGKILLRGAVAVAALGSALLAPATASATAPYETLNEVWTNNRDGQAIFKPHGEHLYACDWALDGDTIVAYAKANGKVVAKATDNNGYPDPCGHTNFSLPEGTHVQIKVCHKEDGYCTKWKDVQDA
ncbi:hypothetical protein [Amycolatopsis sp. NPDC102389]|uniref:hypothetical protein n=1 Tax=Amycolatopsis sp. NPDC102389 TaxID=3363941 RepID=UPI0037F54B63